MTVTPQVAVARPVDVVRADALGERRHADGLADHMALIAPAHEGDVVVSRRLRIDPCGARLRIDPLLASEDGATPVARRGRVGRSFIVGFVRHAC